ncbi:MAG: energy transducer TonB [Pseudomonadota bacterium]
MDLDLPDNEERGRSSDMIILVGALLVVGAMIAWFFLGSDGSLVEEDLAIAVPVSAEEEAISAVIAEDTPNEELLSRARLAAEAGMLVAPAGSNALQYYVLYLEQNPDADDVEVELAAVADRVGAEISGFSSDQRWADAAELVEHLRNAGVAHPSVESFFTTLDTHRQTRSAAAIAAAEAGNEAAANSIIEELSALPRSQPGDVLELRSAVRDALVAKRVADQAAAEAAQRRRAAAAEERRRAAARTAAASQSTQQRSTSRGSGTSTVDPLQTLRAAIDQKSFAGDQGAFAVYAALPAAKPGRDQGRVQLVSAATEAVRDSVAGGDLRQAEQLQQQLAGVDAGAASGLQATIDQAFIERATAEVVSAASLRRTRSVPPTYPRAAERRGRNGRVKVEFTVGTDGVPREIEVVETTSSLFNRSAMQAVSEWRYEPRQVRGQTVVQRVYAYLDYVIE